MTSAAFKDGYARGLSDEKHNRPMITERIAPDTFLDNYDEAQKADWWQGYRHGRNRSSSRFLSVFAPTLDSVPLAQWTQFQTRRVYEAINHGSTRLPRDLAGEFQVDGYTIVVKPGGDTRRAPHRVFLSIGASRGTRLIPIGRVGQAFSVHRWQHTSQSTCSEDGLFMRLCRHQPFYMEIYEIAYWEDLDSSAISMYGKYNVVAGSVDMTHRSQRTAALRFMGLEENENGLVGETTGCVVAAPYTPEYAYCVAEALWAYGEKDVSLDVSGNNLRGLVRQARSCF